MLNLSGISDLVQLVTGVAGSIEVHSSWSDSFGSSSTFDVFGGRTNPTTITTATTTTLVGSPTSGYLRGVSHISIYNAHATVAMPITVRHTDGTNTETLCSCVLYPGEEMLYTATGDWIKFNNAGIPFWTNAISTPNDIQAFTTSGTFWWIKPTSFVPKFSKVIMYGAGGAGAGSFAANQTPPTMSTSTGGGAGCYNTATYMTGDLKFIEQVIVGNGGIGTVHAIGSSANGGSGSSFGTVRRLYAGGGGGGYIPNASDASGGGGGGTFGNGGAGINLNNSGGNPNTQVAGQANAGSGADSIKTSTTGGGCAEFGGGSGGNVQNPGTGVTNTKPGGSSLHGGGGGGCGGAYNAPPGTLHAPGDGGTSQSYTPGGGGLAGTSSDTVPTNGSNGAAGSFAFGGSGGGGGGSCSLNNGVTPGRGGNGGWPGGGGGGSGCCWNNANRVRGGDGADGGVLILTW